MLLFIISNIIIFLSVFIAKKKCKSMNGLIKFASKVWIILFVLELTVFNFRFFTSLNYKEVNVSEYRIGEGLKLNDDGTYQVIDKDEAFFEVYDIYQHLDNIYLDFDNRNNKRVDSIKVSIGYTDSANRNYSYTQDRLMLASNKYSGENIKLYLSGQSKKIKIYINAARSVKFKLKKVSFNRPYEFNVSILRMLIIFMFIMLGFIFRPKSSLYKIKLTDIKAKKYIKTAFILQMILFSGIFFLNTYFIKEDFSKKAPQRNQYQMLAEAFLSGQTYLKEEPSAILKALKSPYDTTDRAELFSGTGEDYLWDVAYYNHKYYVYFGVCPVFVFYLPFHILTGLHIKTNICIYITMFVTLIGLFILLKKIALKWFKNTSLGVFLFLTFMFINGCGLMSIMGRPDHYSLPILMAIGFTIYGLLAWFKAKETEEPKYFAYGSICMALIASCRPQLLITSLFAIPLFKDYVNKDLFKKNLKKAIAFALPYIIIALLVMIYNYVRFGSPFDFGANYNLTTNDMTKRGFVFGRIPLGIFYYLFNLPVLSMVFPFVQRSTVLNNYMGTTIYEEMGAGILIVNCLCMFGFGIFRYRDKFKDKMPYYLGCVSILSAIALIIADTEMAGILPRYICDFGFLVYLATFITMLALQERIYNNYFWQKVILGIGLFMFIYNFFWLFSDQNVESCANYYYIRSVLEFWM